MFVTQSDRWQIRPPGWSISTMRCSLIIDAASPVNKGWTEQRTDLGVVHGILTSANVSVGQLPDDTHPLIGMCGCVEACSRPARSLEASIAGTPPATRSEYWQAPNPNQEPERTLIPDDGAVGDQGSQSRPARQLRLQPAPGLVNLDDAWARQHIGYRAAKQISPSP